MFEEKQRELFSEYENEKERIFRFIKKKDAIGAKMAIIVSREKIIFLTIGLILVVILAFSLGVERGKRIKEKIAVDLEQDEETAQLQKIELEPVTAKKIETIPPSPKKEGLFTVQVVSYKQKELAAKEMEILKRKYSDAFIIQNGQYYEICVGNFSSRQDAKQVVNDLNKRYKDCFIKKR